MGRNEAEDSDMTSEAIPEGEATGHRERKGRRKFDRVRLQEGSRIREPGADPAEEEPLKTKKDKSMGTTTTMLGVSSALNLVRKVSVKMTSKKQGKFLYTY